MVILDPRYLEITEISFPSEFFPMMRKCTESNPRPIWSVYTHNAAIVHEEKKHHSNKVGLKLMLLVPTESVTGALCTLAQHPSGAIYTF